MKKLTALLVTSACALTISSNSFGMLTKASSLKQIKKIRSASYGASIEALYKAREQEALNKTNREAEARNELLNKIIQQNEQNNNLLKENNLLLRTIAKQTFLASDRLLYSSDKKSRKLTEQERPWQGTRCRVDLYNHYDLLKEKYGIDVTHADE